MLRLFFVIWLAAAFMFPGQSVRGDPANPPQLASTSTAEELSGIARITGALSVGGGCTAVLVTPRFALTAGHCAGQAKPVLVFNPNHPSDARRVTVARVTRHPDYDGALKATSAYADLAVLELAENLPPDLARPIPIESAISFDLPHAIYGFVNPGNPPLRGHPQCQVIPVAPGVLGSDCKVQSGLSGAPLLVRAGEHWSVVGIAVATVSSEPRELRALIAEIDIDLIREAGLENPIGWQIDQSRQGAEKQ